MSPEVVLEALGQAAARPDGRHARGYPAGGRGRSVRPVGGTGDGHVVGGRRLVPATEPAQQVRARGVKQVIAVEVKLISEVKGEGGPCTPATATTRLRATTCVGATAISWS